MTRSSSTTRSSTTRELVSSRVARELREAIAAADVAVAGKRDSEYRSASHRLFSIALALDGARSWSDVARRLGVE